MGPKSKKSPKQTIDDFLFEYKGNVFHTKKKMLLLTIVIFIGISLKSIYFFRFEGVGSIKLSGVGGSCRRFAVRHPTLYPKISLFSAM